MSQPRSPKEAKACGAVRYFTGGPCKHGHVAERLTSSRGCVDCAFKRASVWKKNNRDKASTASKRWQAANREKVKALKSAWNKANPEGQAIRSRRWYLANKEKADAATARWRANNLATACAAQARRRAKKVSQTPAWADHAKIKAIYAEARRLSRETGREFHVDHIIPLQSEFVCGLHVETNLQILDGRANRSKSNRLIEELI